LSGRIGEKAWSKTIKIADAKSSKNNEALRCLWARKRIAEISDYIQVDQNSAGIKEVTALGLNYNLLTAYTSFIAVDETVRNLSGQQLTAKQPLPLPEGVSNLAVGGSIPTAPEPSTYLLLIMLSLTLAWSVIRKHTSILQKCSK